MKFDPVYKSPHARCPKLPFRLYIFPRFLPLTQYLSYSHFSHEPASQKNLLYYFCLQQCEQLQTLSNLESTHDFGSQYDPRINGRPQQRRFEQVASLFRFLRSGGRFDCPHSLLLIVGLHILGHLGSAPDSAGKRFRHF